MKYYLLFLFLFLTCSIFGQVEKVKFAIFDGIFIAGYVDNGAFLNCTGPNINAKYGNSKYILGMLPSVRLKKDKKIPRNAFVTPNLGVGFTSSYKVWAIQTALYYNNKTAIENGRWHLGLGLGLRLNEFNKE